MPNFASYTLKPRCYRADRNNRLGEDVSTLILDGTVTVNADDETPMSFSGTVTDPAAIPAFTWFAPFLTVSWWDPEQIDQAIVEQVGLFIALPPGETHTAAQGMGRIEGRDPTWWLKQATMASGASYAAGANVVDSVKADLAALGFTRANIPAKANTFSKKKAFDPGTPWLDSINDRLHRCGCYPLWCDRQGVPTSRPIRKLYREEPVRRIESANGDVVNTVTLDTDTDRLCNRVTVVRNDAAGDPLFSTKTNSRADSPVSTVILGITIGKVIEASNIDTQAEADALALKTLEEGASVLTRLSVDVVPDPHFDVRDVVRLDIRRDDGTVVADGKWLCDQIEIGFTPRQGR
jgi:hypothetical protein